MNREGSRMSKGGRTSKQIADDELEKKSTKDFAKHTVDNKIK